MGEDITTAGALLGLLQQSEAINVGSGRPALQRALYEFITEASASQNISVAAAMGDDNAYRVKGDFGTIIMAGDVLPAINVIGIGDIELKRLTPIKPPLDPIYNCGLCPFRSRP